MSANTQIINEAIRVIANTLNIDIHDKSTVSRILKILSTTPNLGEYLDFIELNFNAKKYLYLTGYQKFIDLTNDFKKDFKPKLTVENSYKANTYSAELYMQLTTILHEVIYTLDEVGKSISEVNFEETLLKSGMKSHQVETVMMIGDKFEIVRLMGKKPTLLSKIEGVVMDRTLKKQCPYLMIENKSSEANVIARLKANSEF